jgi:soluble lytic murein transglycosylase-like protein
MSSRVTIPFLALLAIQALFQSSAWAGEIFLGADANGVITITDSPGNVPGFQAHTPIARPQVPAAAPRGYRASMDRYDQLILGSAQRYGISPALVKAVCLAESGMNPQAVSHAGAQGLMQLMPGTAGDLAVADPFDPAQSIDGGARYLARQVRAFGDLSLALAAYNAGPGTVRSAGGIPRITETERYVDKVLGYYRFFLDQHPVGGRRGSES